MKNGLTALTLLPLLASVACDKSAAEKFNDTFCSYVGGCCKQLGLSGNANTCGQFMSLASAGGHYDSKRGDACLAEMKAEVAAGTFCSASSASAPSACDSVYSGGTSGNKKPGDPCNVDGDCAPSTEGKVVCASLFINNAFVDKCQVQIAGKAGDTPCLGTQEGGVFSNTFSGTPTDVLARGYVYDTANGVFCNGATNACVALLSAGAPCIGSSECLRTTYCKSPPDVCTARVASGDACSPTDDSPCVDGFYCNSVSKTCVAKLANTSPCSDSQMCQSDYCSGTCQSNPLSSIGSALGFALLCGS